MRKGIKIEIDEVGEGKVAERGTSVRIRYDLLLSRGDVVQKGIEMKVDLFDRETVAGLRYGIEGMRVGGRRRFRASPHLAYGESGVPEMIPPNAVLVFDVELLEVTSYPYAEVEAV
ncbi:MAG: 46 kDa FK506-binding nuclear protein-like isoform [Chthonomonadaceae bacterium]|nr:46 kDa FK506-binding nuclear protein-like isoform [Chthonomonadaceae bacterium]